MPYLCPTFSYIMQKNDEKEQETNSTTYDHVLKYTGLFGGVQGVNLLAALVRNKLVSLIIGPAGLGLVSLYNTAVSLLGNATNLGLPFSSVRHVSELYEQGDADALSRFVRVVRSWTLLTALLGVVACCLLSPLLSLSYFKTADRWTDFLWLSPVVGLTALSGGELALLKGARRLREVAVQSLLNSLCAILLTVPLYYWWGSRAILASLLLVSLSTWGTAWWFSRKTFPFAAPDGVRFSLSGGGQMVRLGVAFILAGILGSGVEFVIRAYMMQTGTEAVVGLYNAGYVLTVTYASMVFTAMETDFFPRLSAVNHDVRLSNETVNRQVEVSVLLISPLLVAFLVGLPVILPLLYSSKFLPVTEMARCAVFSMYLRAVALPVSYLSLAKARSGVYLFTEAVYDLAAVLLIVTGFTLDGLRGTGIALSLAALFDLLLVWLTARRLYGFRLGSRAVHLLGVQFPFGVAAFAVSCLFTGWAYWLTGGLLAFVSAALSWRVLRRETTFVEKIKRKLNR